MSDTIYHHHALGIHPGAFVQPTAPATDDVQDGVLWVDTGPGTPPYQLKVWRASVPAWQTVGIVTSGVDTSGLLGSDCLTYPNLAQLCNPSPDVVQVRTPGGTHSLDATGYDNPIGGRIEGALSPSIFPSSMIGEFNTVDDEDLIHQPPEGTYSLACTLHTADFESPVLGGLVNITFGPPGSSGPFANQVAVNPGFAPHFAIGAPLPAPFTAISWYIVPWPFVSPPPGVLGKFTTTTTNEWVYITPGDGSSPPTTDRSRTPIMRFMHDGDALDVVLPLGTLSATPEVLVGKNPATSLPAYCPAPPASPAQILTPVPVAGATVDTCVQMRCGVSLNCTNHLVSLYDNWARWLNPLFAVSGALAFGALLEELGGAILEAEAAESTAAVWSQFKPLLQGAFGVLSGNLLPFLVPDTRNDVQKMLFCALTCEGGEVILSPAQINAWHVAQGAYSGWAVASLQGQLVQLLTQFTPLQDWLTAASTASASSACDLWTCP